MAHLSEAQKTFIVQRLACWRTPSEVVDDVKETFGIEIPREQVRQYNPLQVRVAAKWQALFDATRKKFIDEVAAEAIAHQAFRLREYLDLYRTAKSRKNLVLAAQLLEQAAKEAGGAYTNHRTHDNLNVDLSNLTDDQLDRLAKGEDIRKVLGG